MSFGILNVGSNIVSSSKLEWKSGGICPKPMPNPNEIMKEQADKFIKKQEEKSLNKSAEDRNIGDWINVASSYVRKFVNFAENTKKY